MVADRITVNIMYIFSAHEDGDELLVSYSMLNTLKLQAVQWTNVVQVKTRVKWTWRSRLLSNTYVRKMGWKLEM